jgi:protocatechuate 3,4-dioxygenase beta subunit
MTSVKRLFNCSLFLTIFLVAQSWLITNAQMPDNKPKATASIAGRVTIGDKPAPGVTVAVTNVTPPQMLIGQTVSDSEGKYRIAGLVPGQINVSAVAPTYVVPVSPMFTSGQSFSLSADEAVEGIDFKLTRGGVITGRIADADGKPVIEERVTLTLLDEKGQPSRTQVSRAPNFFMYSTDDRGIYRIYGLSAGKYRVSAGDNGTNAVLRSGYYQKTYYPDVTDVAKAGIVELTEGGEAKNIDITLGARSRTYTVTGRIVDADTGQPMAGITYAFGALQQNQGMSQAMMAGFSSPSTPTNAKGEFRLEGVAPGKYAVMTLRSPLNQNADQPKVYSDPVPFEVTDSDLSDIEVKAQRGLSISGVVITDGIVNKAALAGVSRLIVTGYPSPNPNTIQTFSGNATSPIAGDGTFQLEGLHPGKVALSIAGTPESRGYTVSRIVADREVTNRQIELAAGQNISGVRIYVQYGSGVLKGEVKITGGTLPSDAMLYISVQKENQPRLTSALVDSRGRFVLSGIPAGTYEAVLQIMSFGTNNLPNGLPRMQRQTVNVNDDAESQIIFTLDFTRKEGP